MEGGLNLGSFTKPVLIFGGPYSNLQALQALKAEAEWRKIPADHCLCTGDVVAYCGDPEETVALIRAWGVTVVQGNCEQALAAGAPECGCGFEAGTACDVLSRHWYAYAAAHLNAEVCAWMGSLPPTVRFEMAGRRIVALHGAMDNISRFVFASTPEHEKREQAALADADVVVAGHCGLPFTQVLENGTIWHNAGAIGLPANDGTPDVWYSILMPKNGEINLTHHRLVYDWPTAAKRLREKGSGAGYAWTLESGRWPSLDVLPPQERAATGRPLVGKELK